MASILLGDGVSRARHSRNATTRLSRNKYDKAVYPLVRRTVGLRRTVLPV